VVVVVVDWSRLLTVRGFRQALAAINGGDYAARVGCSSTTTPTTITAPTTANDNLLFGCLCIGSRVPHVALQNTACQVLFSVGIGVVVDAVVVVVVVGVCCHRWCCFGLHY